MTRPSQGGKGGSAHAHDFVCRTDESGFHRRSVVLRGERLVIEGHDLGRAVQDAFGHEEREFTRALDRWAMRRLCTLLGCDRDDLVGTIAERFDSSHQLESFLEEHGVPSVLEVRTGD